MSKKRISLLFISIILVWTYLLVSCGLLEPEKGKATLFIRLKESSEEALSKSQETLNQMRCIVKKGSGTVYDQTVSAQSGRFKCEVGDLDPGSGYSVYLYGLKSSEIVARAFEGDITLQDGQSKEVVMYWSDFTAQLSSPADGSTIQDNTPSFDWSSVSGASAYELIVDNSSSFGSPEINRMSLSSSNYTATSELLDDTYYWGVRCKDNQNNWGGWSETWSFTISTDPYEPNDTRSQAYQISFSGSPPAWQSGTGPMINPSTDQDWFKFYASSGDTLIIFCDVTSELDPEIVLYLGSTRVAYKDNYSSGGDEELAYTVTTSGTYYVGIGYYSNISKASFTMANTGSYELTVLKVEPETETVTDIDGNTYQTIKIGNQWWMAENLKVTHYRNGDAIPNVTDNTAWTGLTTGAYCNYDNNSSNVATYGRLYNWYAVDDSRNIAPEGWHVPSDEEWKELEMYLGMSQSDADAYGWRGTDEGGKLKETGTTHWNSPNTGATNESGFTALPGGYRGGGSGSFYYIGGYAGFWSATGSSSSSAWCRYLYSSNSGITRSGYGKQGGFSVRLVRD